MTANETVIHQKSIHEKCLQVTKRFSVIDKTHTIKQAVKDYKK